jgi:tetratricopeptide (TPR) repeat protein
MKMGKIKYKVRKFDEALTCYHRAVDILKEFDHTEIAHDLEWIGFIWSKKQCYDRATEYYEQCSKLREASLSPTHLSIVNTLLRLDRVQRSRHQYEHSLTYELKGFLIREQVLPPDHQDIGRSLANIDECYEVLNQHKLALGYYKRALVVYEQTCTYTASTSIICRLKD